MIAILKLVPSVKPRRTERYPGNYPSTDDAEALISEEADRNSQIQKDTRELVFTPSTKIYLIGRASGNPTRGLVARRNNGFFLSPVMSRYHAEVQMLESKVNQNSLFITLPLIYSCDGNLRMTSAGSVFVGLKIRATSTQVAIRVYRLT